MFFNRLLFSQKSSAIAVPKYASNIFLTILTEVHLDCLKLTYQVFRTAIFQDAPGGLILSYDLISLLPSI